MVNLTGEQKKTHSVRCFSNLGFFFLENHWIVNNDFDKTCSRWHSVGNMMMVVGICTGCIIPIKNIAHFMSFQWMFCGLKPQMFQDNGRPILFHTVVITLTCCDVGYWKALKRKPGEEECCWQKEEGWHKISPSKLYCHIFEILRGMFQMHLQAMASCQSCPSTAAAVLIYRQLYLVVMLFYFFIWIKTVCLSGIEKHWGHSLRLALGLPARSLLFILSFTVLLGRMQYLLAVSIPTWALLAVPLRIC